MDAVACAAGSACCGGEARDGASGRGGSTASSGAGTGGGAGGIAGSDSTGSGSQISAGNDTSVIVLSGSDGVVFNGVETMGSTPTRSASSEACSERSSVVSGIAVWPLRVRGAAAPRAAGGAVRLNTSTRRPISGPDRDGGRVWPSAAESVGVAGLIATGCGWICPRRVAGNLVRSRETMRRAMNGAACRSASRTPSAAGGAVSRGSSAVDVFGPEASTCLASGSTSPGFFVGGRASLCSSVAAIKARASLRRSRV